MYLCRIFCLSFVFLGTVEERLNRSVFFFKSFYGREKIFFSFCVLTRVDDDPCRHSSISVAATWWWVDDAHINNTQQPRWLVIFPRLQIGTFFFFFGGDVRLCVTRAPTTTTTTATHLWWWWMTTTKNIIDFDVDIFSLYSGNTLEKVNTLAYTHCVSFFSLMKMNEFLKKKKNKKKENLQIPFYNHMVHF